MADRAPGSRCCATIVPRRASRAPGPAGPGRLARLGDLVAHVRPEDLALSLPIPGDKAVDVDCLGGQPAGRSREQVALAGGKAEVPDDLELMGRLDTLRHDRRRGPLGTLRQASRLSRSRSMSSTASRSVSSRTRLDGSMPCPMKMAARRAALNSSVSRVHQK